MPGSQLSPHHDVVAGVVVTPIATNKVYGQCLINHRDPDAINIG